MDTDFAFAPWGLSKACIFVSTLVPLNEMRFAGKLFCNCYLRTRIILIHVIHLCLLIRQESFFETHRDVIPLQCPARAERCWCMTNPHGENPGVDLILNGDDKRDMDHSELCSVKVSRSLPSVRTRLHRTLLGQLAMCRSAAEPLLCEFWTSGSFNSASIWLIAIRRQDFFLQLNCHGKWDACWIGMDLGWFGCVCCPAAWELLGSVKVSRSLATVNAHWWDSWQCVEVPQSLYFANFERAEVSTLLPLDSLRFARKFFCNCYLKSE